MDSNDTLASQCSREMTPAELDRQNKIEQLVEQASVAMASGQWMKQSYDRMWLGPEEAQRHFRDGHFLEQRWEVACPYEHLEELRGKAVNAKRKFEDFETRVDSVEAALCSTS